MRRIKFGEPYYGGVGRIHPWGVCFGQRMERLRFGIEIESRPDITVFDESQNDFVILKQPASLLEISRAGQDREGRDFPKVASPDFPTRGLGPKRDDETRISDESIA